MDFLSPSPQIAAARAIEGAKHNPSEARKSSRQLRRIWVKLGLLGSVTLDDSPDPETADGGEQESQHLEERNHRLALLVFDKLQQDRDRRDDQSQMLKPSAYLSQHVSPFPPFRIPPWDEARRGLNEDAKTAGPSARIPPVLHRFSAPRDAAKIAGQPQDSTHVRPSR